MNILNTGVAGFHNLPTRKAFELLNFDLRSMVDYLIDNGMPQDFQTFMFRFSNQLTDDEVKTLTHSELKTEQLTDWIKSRAIFKGFDHWQK